MSSPTALATLAPVAALITLVELAAGTAVVALFIDVSGGVGRGFRGTTALICAVVVGVALLIASALPDPAAILAGGDAATFASAVHWMVVLLALLVVDALFAAVGTDGARHVAGALAAAAGLVAVVSVSRALVPADGAQTAALLTAVPATLLCGSALAGMLLGHWYLLAPDLTFRPLRIAVYTVFAAVAVDALAIGAGLLSAPAAVRDSVLAGGYALPFWLLVVGSGVLFTAAVNGLTLYFARIRANQPATAMLYVLIVSALMGTVPGLLIFLRTGAGF